MYKHSVLAAVALSTLLFSCKNNATTDASVTQEADTVGFINVKNIFDDQWQIKKEEPNVLMRTIQYDDKIDTAYINQDSTLFYDLAEYFIDADISDPKFTKEYDYSESLDNESGMVFMHILAKDPNLFTQKLELTMDRYTSKLLNVYIETRHESLFNDKSQKLLYSVEKGFFIQEKSKRMFSEAKTTFINYYFKY